MIDDRDKPRIIKALKRGSPPRAVAHDFDYHIEAIEMFWFAHCQDLEAQARQAIADGKTDEEVASLTGLDLSVVAQLKRRIRAEQEKAEADRRKAEAETAEAARRETETAEQESDDANE